MIEVLNAQVMLQMSEFMPVLESRCHKALRKEGRRDPFSSVSEG